MRVMQTSRGKGQGEGGGEVLGGEGGGGGEGGEGGGGRLLLHQERGPSLLLVVLGYGGVYLLRWDI